MNIEKVLVLSPHADDGDLGAGGTIARFIEEGLDIHLVVFSICGRSLPDGLPGDTLRKECLCSTATLGLSPDQVILLDYEVRTFPTWRQEILENMIEFRDRIRPDLVLIPSSSDMHQDHNTVHWEALRAFKKVASIWGYEHPWNNITFSTDIFIRLEEKHLVRKMEALRCYESQSFKSYFDEEYVRSLAYTRGSQVDWPYAEAYELVRLLV